MAEPSPGSVGPVASWRDLVSRRANLLAIALLFLITLPLLTKIFTSDFGTHIAIGRQIVQTRSLPDREFLNYPSLGISNPNGEWGFEVILYLVFAAGGEYGVSLLCWAVTLGIFLLLHRATVLRGGHPLLTVAALFAFSGFLRIRIQPRPEIFTYLFIALTIYILTEYHFGKRKRLVYLFPPLALVWANCHPTYLMAFLLCGAFFADALARAAWGRRFSWGQLRAWVVPPVAAGLLGLMVCGLNPHGYDAILTPLRLISRGGEGGGSAVLMSISELTPVKGTGMFVYYKAAAAFAAVSLLLGAAGRRVYLLDLFLFAISFKGAWDSARAVSMMGLFLSPGASLHITGFLERVGEWAAAMSARREREARKMSVVTREAGGKKGKRPERAREAPAAVRREPTRRLPWIRAVAAGVVVSAMAAFGVVNLSFSLSQLEYGVGLTEHKFSLAAGEFLRKNPVPGRMFNFFDVGGFLDWQLYPQALTFIDGRTYNPQVFMEHQAVTGAMPGWEEILRKYGVTYVVTKTMDSSGMILPLINALASHPDWDLVFADGLFVVFVRNTPETAGYIQAFALPKSQLPRHMLWEAYHYMYLGVSPVMAHYTMSTMYEAMGDRAGAIEALRKGLEVADEPFLRARLEHLERGGGAPGRLPGNPHHPPGGPR